jgi:archaellum component FlaG (FlaF/FlaG flagellin family)
MRSNHPGRHAHDSTRHLRARSRRGESTIIANLILFIAVMGMTSATVFIFKNLLDEGASAAADEQDRAVGVMRTDFAIPSAVYNPGTVTVYVKNTGQKSFDPGDIDVYVNGLRVPRNESNRTIDVVADTDTTNSGIWDGGEDLEIAVFRTFAIPATHTVTIYTPNGVKREAVFSS